LLVFVKVFVEEYEVVVSVWMGYVFNVSL